MSKEYARNVDYHKSEDEELGFIVDSYTRAKPFSSFFPGIAGLTGIPLWCFYVNRGQAVCSFGVDSKDGAIMEFQPANKAYRQVSTQGFRTFIKYSCSGHEGFYEPFQENQANLGFKLQNRMVINPYNLIIEEVNDTLGIMVKVTYFTVPEEPMAALARSVTITNLTDQKMKLEVLDGMPVIIPYGMWDTYMKNMSRTIEAWAFVENLENKIPFFRLKVNAEDSSEVVQVRRGNFYLSFLQDGSESELLTPVIDPELIFGHINDLSYPFEFCRKDFDQSIHQEYSNRTACAMGYSVLKLPGNAEKTIYSAIGHAESLKSLNNICKGWISEEFFRQKEKQNEKLVRQVMDSSYVNSSSNEFNAYARQSFLDNTLRGGLPINLKADNKAAVMYVYSRRHGDLERDYNSFRLMPAYFSQGNGAYRDINQNRRNDIWFNRQVGYSNIRYFMNLIQLDGFNPLIVKGVSYVIEDIDRALLKDQVQSGDIEKLAEFLKKPFIPYSLLQFVQENKIKPAVSDFEFISKLIVSSKEIEEAEHGEGYWSDHWHYNLDLIESYEALYPDKMRTLLTEDRLFSFFEDDCYVVPRKERYVLCNGKPRQFGCIKRDREKTSILLTRETEPCKVRTENGKGKIYYTSLFTKLLCICTNKIASLDQEGVGIEMEGGKPNWNDAVNGLPSFFGSSVSETFELKRLMQHMQRWIVQFGLIDKKLLVPFELHEFMVQLYVLLSQTSDGQSDADRQEYWDLSNMYKENFREKVRYGVKGNEISMEYEQLFEFLNAALDRLEKAVEKAYDCEKKVYNTYFINEPVRYKVLKEETPAGKTESKYVTVSKFRQIPLPLFLEGQVHAMRTELNTEKNRELYHSVLSTGLYDEKLGMYKVNVSLSDFPMELGRLRAFTPGWLENESVFLHMEYKYLLEILKAGLSAEFYRDIGKALVPFMKPEVYGRSIFENSSFIASSANPDKNIWGRGFVARLSGTTAEFYNILLVMALGVKPFRMSQEGSLELVLEPKLAGWLFTEINTESVLFGTYGEEKIILHKNTYAFRVFGDTLLVYHNEHRANTYGDNSASVSKIILAKSNGEELEFTGKCLSAPYAEYVREGQYSRIGVILE